MQEYVCGFLFSTDRERVLLIRKRRPAWQAGRLNGVGGKVEAGETPEAAMAREFREEAGLSVEGWKKVVVLTGEPSPADARGWRGHFFRAFGDLGGAVAQTDEALEVHPVRPLPADAIPNLNWIVPLMLDDEVGHPRSYRVEVVPKTE